MQGSPVFLSVPDRRLPLLSVLRLFAPIHSQIFSRGNRTRGAGGKIQLVEHQLYYTGFLLRIPKE